MAKERITWEQLSNLTPGNGAVQSLRDLLIMTNFVDEELVSVVILDDPAARQDIGSD
jgi:hypothetical protein